MGLGQYILTTARVVAGPAGWPPPLPPLTHGDGSAASQTITLPLTDGQTEATVYLPMGVPSGVIIALHAGGADRRCTWPWVEPLRDAGFACIAPDLDGHGGNTRPFTSVTRAAEVALAALDAVPSLGLPSSVALMGGSLGGVIALRAAEIRATATDAPCGQAGVSALVLLATPYTSPFWQMLNPHVLRSAWEGQQIVGTAVRRAGPRPRFAALRDSLARENLLQSTHAVAGRPMLLVCGQYDPFAPPWQGRAYQQAHGDAALRVVPAAHAGALYGGAAIMEATAWLAQQPLPYS